MMINKALIEAYSMTPDLMFNNYDKLTGVENNVTEIHLEYEKEKLYTSTNLRKHTCQIFKRYRKFKPIHDSINALIEDNTIIPAMPNIDNNLFRLWKMLPVNETKKHIMGYYHTGYNRIFLMLENSVNQFGMCPDVNIAELIVHELMHYMAHNNNILYVKHFSKHLFSFYKSFFMEYFDLPKNTDIDNEVRRFTKKAIGYELSARNMEVESVSPRSILTEIHKIKNKSKRNCHNEIMAMIKIYNMYDQAINLKDILKVVPIMQKPMFNSYKQLFESTGLENGHKINSIMFQELIAPSEILAIYAGYMCECSVIHNDNVPYTLIRSINNRKDSK